MFNNRMLFMILFCAYVFIQDCLNIVWSYLNFLHIITFYKKSSQCFWGNSNYCYGMLFHFPLSLSSRGSLVLHFSAIRVVSSAYLRLLIFPYIVMPVVDCKYFWRKSRVKQSLCLSDKRLKISHG